MNDQELLFKSIPCDKYDLLTKEEVVTLHKDAENLISQLIKQNKKLNDKLIASEQKHFLLSEQTINIKHRLFGKSSEKINKEFKGKKKPSPSK